MSISKRTRFEIFKRDDFTCQYCGKKPPEVILEIDHIQPKSKQGIDDINNYLTCCFDCNRGKGNIELKKIPPTLQENLEVLREKEAQLNEYNKVLKKIRERKNQNLKEIQEYWDKVFNLSPFWYPHQAIRMALDFIPKEKILESVDICKDSYRKQDERCFGESIKAYFYGILRKKTNNFGRE